MGTDQKIRISEQCGGKWAWPRKKKPYKGKGEGRLMINQPIFSQENAATLSAIYIYIYMIHVPGAQKECVKYNILVLFIIQGRNRIHIQYYGTNFHLLFLSSSSCRRTAHKTVSVCVCVCVCVHPLLSGCHIT